MQARRSGFARWSVPVLTALLGSFFLAPPTVAAPSFDALVAEGQPRLGRVRELPGRGREHVPAGTDVATELEFPLSGPHWPRPTMPGFYQEPQPKGALIHALEHGNVVIYYDELDADARRTLMRWTARFDGPWSGLVAVPHPGLGDDVVLTAWRHRLDLPYFDDAVAAAFIDAYRGRGPENPVR